MLKRRHLPTDVLAVFDAWRILPKALWTLDRFEARRETWSPASFGSELLSDPNRHVPPNCRPRLVQFEKDQAGRNGHLPRGSMRTQCALQSSRLGDDFNPFRRADRRG